MASIAASATQRLMSLCRGEEGLAPRVLAAARRANERLAGIGAENIVQRNASADLSERGAGMRYPVFHVYCERVSNELTEKFRRFSGKVRLAIEARVSQDRIEGLEERTQLYVEAITTLLENNRGDWGEGLFFTGAYEVTFGPVKSGGRNYLQTAKVTIEVDASAG